MASDFEGSDASSDPTSHMSGRMSSRMTVIGRVSGRRRWTVEQKLLMLRDAFGSGGCVRAAMELHEVSSGQLYTWRHQAMSGELSGVAALPPPLLEPVPCFAEVAIAEPEPLSPLRVIAEPAQVPVGQIGIELSSGIKGTVSNFVCGRAIEHYAAMALMKRSPKMTANWALAMDHSRGGIFHSFSDRFKIR
jgi:transposase